MREMFIRQGRKEVITEINETAAEHERITNTIIDAGDSVDTTVANLKGGSF